MMRRGIVIIGLWIIGASLYASELNLDAYVLQVDSSNLSIRAAQDRAEGLNRRAASSGTWDDPFVAIGVDEVPFDNNTGDYVWRYQISQTIPFFGKPRARVQVATYQAAVAQSECDTIRRFTRLRAIQTFFQCYYLKRAIELTGQLITQGTSAVDRARLRYETGGPDYHEWLLAKAKIAILQVEKCKLLREQLSLNAQLNQLRGRTPNAIIEPLVLQLTTKNITQSDDELLANQPEMAGMMARLYQSERQKELADLSFFPDVTIQAMMMKPSTEMMIEKSNWGVMVGANIPLYFFSKQSNLATAARVDNATWLNEKKNLEILLKDEVLDARQQLKTAGDIVALYHTVISPMTNLAAQNAKTGYLGNRLPLTQLIDIITIQATQELEYLAAQMDVRLSLARLENLVSSPPMMRLAPNRPTLFGGGAGMGMSEPLKMGRGMNTPARDNTLKEPSSTKGSGMEGM